MRVRFRRRPGRATSPIWMIVVGIVGAAACFAVAGADAGPAPPTSRAIDPTNTWGPALMGVLLLLVAAAGVYLLVQQIREYRNLTSADDHGHLLLAPGERTVAGPLPPAHGPVEYPPMPTSQQSDRPPWER